MQRDSMEISLLFPLEIPGNMTVLYKHWHPQLRLEKKFHSLRNEETP